MGRPEMQSHMNSKNPDESSTGILALLVSLSQDVQNAMDNAECLRDEIKGNQKDLVNLKEEVSSKVDEGFKREQQARQQIQCEIVQDSNTKKMQDSWFRRNLQS